MASRKLVSLVSDWNPSLYRQFEDERTRPASDLLARLPLLPPPRRIVDLGCGPGNSTELLVRRYPQAEVTGLDHSPAMLAAARARLPDTEFAIADIAEWAPEQIPDLLFANAVLQWVPDHEQLFPRLLNEVSPGGVLAVQMPDNLEAPTHSLMRDIAAHPAYASLLGDASRMRTPILPPEAYHDLLCPHAAVDIWRTTYHHRLRSPAEIVQWLRPTGLKPYLDRLPPDLQVTFLSEYERQIQKAYPVRADGSRLLAFPRLFILAVRRSA